MNHVILYVNGTHRLGRLMDIDRFVAGIATALGPAFRPSGLVETVEHRDTAIAQRTIERRGSGCAWRPYAVVVEADYYDLFLAQSEGWLPGRAVRGTALVLGNLGLAPRILRYRTPGRFMLQFLYLLAMVVVLLLRPLAALVGAWLIAAALLNQLDDLGFDQLGDIRMVAVTLTLLAVFKVLSDTFVPASWRELVAMMARDPLCMLAYFARRKKAKGLNERIMSRLDVASDYAATRFPGVAMTVMSYSFGAIVAYDWLLGRRPAAGVETVLERPQVDALVALGFPFAMVSTFWPDYYAPPDGTVPFAAFHSFTLESDLVGGPVPEPLRTALEARLGADNVRDHVDPLPAELAAHQSRFRFRAAIQAHAAYFGFGDIDKAPALHHCAAVLQAQDAAAPHS